MRGGRGSEEAESRRIETRARKKLERHAGRTFSREEWQAIDEVVGVRVEGVEDAKFYAEKLGELAKAAPLLVTAGRSRPSPTGKGPRPATLAGAVELVGFVAERAVGFLRLVRGELAVGFGVGRPKRGQASLWAALAAEWTSAHKLLPKSRPTLGHEYRHAVANEHVVNALVSEVQAEVRAALAYWIQAAVSPPEDSPAQQAVAAGQAVRDRQAGLRAQLYGVSREKWEEATLAERHEMVRGARVSEAVRSEVAASRSRPAILAVRAAGRPNAQRLARRTEERVQLLGMVAARWSALSEEERVARCREAEAALWRSYTRADLIDMRIFTLLGLHVGRKDAERAWSEPLRPRSMEARSDRELLNLWAPGFPAPLSGEQLDALYEAEGAETPAMEDALARVMERAEANNEMGE